MKLTAELISDMGFDADELPVSDNMMFNAALEWMSDNTDFGDLSTTEAVTQLPASAKVFLIKYVDLMKNGVLSGSNVSSESIAGMSKSYKSSTDAEREFRILAFQLLGDHYLGGMVRTAPVCSRWL